MLQPDTAIADELGLRLETSSDLFVVHDEAAYGGPNDEYRYWLTRRWEDGGTTVTWVMLNPSTATAFADDNTIRRCIGYARAWGHSGLHVVNLFAWRATNPAELREVDDPVGEHNDEIIRRHCQPGAPVIAAWGFHGRIRHRAYDVTQMLAGLGVELSCLERTSDGNPRHPLYCLSELTPKPYHPPW